MMNRMAQNRNAAGAIQQAMARNNAMRRPAAQMPQQGGQMAIPSPFLKPMGPVGQMMPQMAPQGMPAMQGQQNPIAMLMQMLAGRQTQPPQQSPQLQGALQQLLQGRR